MTEMMTKVRKRLRIWDDAIDKYFGRPYHEIFDNTTYPDYFKNHTIRSKPPGPNSKLFSARDQKKPLVLLRFTFYKIEDGEPFFFQYLIMKVPARLEQELKGGYGSYRERFQAMLPLRYRQAVNSVRKSYLE